MDILIRRRFGLSPDPWAGRHQQTADAERAAALVAAAADSQAMVSIVGPRGTGKTTAIRRALARSGARVVEVQRLDRERVHLGDVATALVRDLSDERPLHSGEARTAQARRLLGHARERVVLFIDDAHALHYQTLRGLKRLRELAWRGRSPLLGIVLAGQTDRTAALPEVGLRTATASFGGLTAAEAERALRSALDGALGGGAVEALVSSSAAANWLDLQELADRSLLAAAARGARLVTAACVAAAAGAPEEDDGQPDAGDAAPDVGAAIRGLEAVS